METDGVIEAASPASNDRQLRAQASERERENEMERERERAREREREKGKELEQLGPPTSRKRKAHLMSVLEQYSGGNAFTAASLTRELRDAADEAVWSTHEPSAPFSLSASVAIAMERGGAFLPAGIVASSAAHQRALEAIRSSPALAPPKRQRALLQGMPRSTGLPPESRRKRNAQRAELTERADRLRQVHRMRWSYSFFLRSHDPRPRLSRCSVLHHALRLPHLDPFHFACLNVRHALSPFLSHRRWAVSSKRPMLEGATQPRRA